MASDAEWVEDVKRWYFAGQRDERTHPAAPAEGAASGEVGDAADALGYEAAHPALQARHWPDAPIETAPSALR